VALSRRRGWQRPESARARTGPCTRRRQHQADPRLPGRWLLPLLQPAPCCRLLLHCSGGAAAARQPSDAALEAATAAAADATPEAAAAAAASLLAMAWSRVCQRLRLLLFER
jgi:hypothetical protein